MFQTMSFSLCAQGFFVPGDFKFFVFQLVSRCVLKHRHSENKRRERARVTTPEFFI